MVQSKREISDAIKGEALRDTLRALLRFREWTLCGTPIVFFDWTAVERFGEMLKGKRGKNTKWNI